MWCLIKFSSIQFGLFSNMKEKRSNLTLHLCLCSLDHQTLCPPQRAPQQRTSSAPPTQAAPSDGFFSPPPAANLLLSLCWSSSSMRALVTLWQQGLAALHSKGHQAPRRPSWQSPAMGDRSELFLVFSFQGDGKWRCK